MLIVSLLLAKASFPQTNISYGETLTGNISVDGEVDIFTFFGNAGDKVLIVLTENSASPQLEPKIKLFRPSGQLMDTVVNNAQASLFKILPINGTYTLFISDDYPGDDTGDYALFIQRTFDPGMFTDISYGQTHTGDITTDGEMDTFVFEDTAGDKVLITLTENSTNPSLEPRFNLEDPTGDLLSTEWNNAQVSYFIILQSTGTFTIIVSDDYPGDDTGDYALFIQRTFDPGMATNISYGQTLTDNIDTDGEVDTYQFQGSVNDSVIINLTEFSSSPSLEPFIQLYAPTGNFLNSAFHNSQATLGFRLQESGYYTILASDYYPGDDQGNYSIFLFGFEAPNTETVILTYSFPEQTDPAIINPVSNTVDIEVEYGTILTDLIATFTLSDGATATVGGEDQQSGITENDFTSPVIYVVTAEDGITVQDWEVIVSLAPSTETDILTYSFPEQTNSAIIDPVSHTIIIEVEYGTILTELVATFVLSDGATATVGGVNQQSGTTANDFTNPVTYVVTAEDGVTTQDWLVTVDTLTGIFEFSNPTMSIYPNPFTNKATIEFPNPSHSNYILSIFSISGNKVFEMQNIRSNKIEFERGNLPGGVYIVELRGEKVFRGKMIIK